MNADRLRTLFDLTGRTAIITGGTRDISPPAPTSS